MNPYYNVEYSGPGDRTFCFQASDIPTISQTFAVILHDHAQEKRVKRLKDRFGKFVSVIDDINNRLESNEEGSLFITIPEGNDRRWQIHIGIQPSGSTRYAVRIMYHVS